MSADADLRLRVEALAAYGTPHTEIARVFRLDLEVLRKDFEEELATGRTKANSRVAETLYRTAFAGGREGSRRRSSVVTRTPLHDLSADDAFSRHAPSLLERLRLTVFGRR